ncbi:hypothetical protein BOTBODRAFT_30699 [Botryobasidium botryosum FD-172 SS1]|uniref:SGS domain-containing protein n=1 Tax=Botryobasidium botryosum (strain FD-172 SS1) TaxID=930990 RepID=A0A067MZ86_BOTB1|nr:hypothetical protein BOTBODRAFT_30699 [Botryobasidium botryosum FD-172 SS1]
MSTEPRHEFYESDERVTISVFIKDAKAEDVFVTFKPRRLTLIYGDKRLDLQPLQGEIDADQSGFRISKYKIEVWLSKRVGVRWGKLVGEGNDMATFTQAPAPPASTSDAPASNKPKKNWDKVATKALEAEGPDKTTADDPNAGGDAALNSFFQQIYSGADEDTRRAMMKSFQESGGTALSTNWDEVKKGKVEVKPPHGSEAKKY